MKAVWCVKYQQSVVRDEYELKTVKSFRVCERHDTATTVVNTVHNSENWTEYAGFVKCRKSRYNKYSALRLYAQRWDWRVCVPIGGVCL